MAVFAAKQVVSFMGNEQQRQNLLLKVDKRSTFHNNFRDKLMKQGEKRETSTLNLQRNNAARKVEGFCISYF